MHVQIFRNADGGWHLFKFLPWNSNNKYRFDVFLMWQVTVATSVKTGHLFCFTSYSKNESYEKKKEKNACSDIHSTKCSGGHGNFVKMIKNAGIYYLFICLFVCLFLFFFIYSFNFILF